MTDQTARMRQLADTLNQASQAYYFGSEPIMSDMDWDKLYDELSAGKGDGHRPAGFPDAPGRRRSDDGVCAAYAHPPPVEHG